MTSEVHPPEQRETLRRAGLSMRSELTDVECDRLRLTTEWLAAKDRASVSENQIRDMILADRDPRTGRPARRSKGGSMPATKTKKTHRESLSSAQVGKLAAIRRKGGTWSEVDNAAGFRVPSGVWASIFEEHGFDKKGVKEGSNQSSKARTRNSNGSAKPKRRVRRKK